MTRVIAEVGCNHTGSMEIAHRMIGVAAECGADVVKFQKRARPKELVPEYLRPHPDPAASYGSTYGEHREALEFSGEQHRQLGRWCEDAGVEYSTSVWDLTSAHEIIKLKPKMIKIPSACNLNRHLLGLLADEFPGQIHVSLGMTTREETEKIVSFFEDRGRAHDMVIYACTSGYPVAFGDVGLAEITRLREAFGERVGAIGFSGHHLGIAVDVAALALGAEVIERHFTLDRTWRGTDHAASLEPHGLRRLVRDVRHVSLALPAKREEILPVELVQREKLKKRQIRWIP